MNCEFIWTWIIKNNSLSAFSLNLFWLFSRALLQLPHPQKQILFPKATMPKTGYLTKMILLGKQTQVYLIIQIRMSYLTKMILLRKQAQVYLIFQIWMSYLTKMILLRKQTQVYLILQIGMITKVMVDLPVQIFHDYLRTFLM